MSCPAPLAPQPTVPLSRRPSPVRRRGWAIRIVGGLVVSTAGIVVTVGSWLLLVDHPRGRRLDDAVMVAAENRLAFVRAEMLGLLDLVSVGSVALAALAIVAIGMVRNRPGAVIAAGTLVLGSQLVTQALKAVLPRDGGGAENSLPSGHVTVVTALVAATLLVLPVTTRLLAGLAGAVIVLGASVSVIVAGWHRPGDVLAAYGVIAAVGGALWFVDGLRSVTVTRLRRRSVTVTRLRRRSVSATRLR